MSALDTTLRCAWCETPCEDDLWCCVSDCEGRAFHSPLCSEACRDAHEKNAHPEWRAWMAEERFREQVAKEER